MLLHQAELGLFSNEIELTESAIAKATQHMLPDMDNITERWKLYEMYVYLAKKMRGEELDFRLAKWINEIPIFSRDKAGGNVEIIIGQLMVWLIRGEYGKLIDRCDSVKVYAHRYLKGEEAKRAKLMIQIFRDLVLSDFEKTDFSDRTRIAYTELTRTPRRISDVGSEVLSYEKLHEYILMLL